MTIGTDSVKSSQDIAVKDGLLRVAGHALSAKYLAGQFLAFAVIELYLIDVTIGARVANITKIPVFVPDILWCQFIPAGISISIVSIQT